MAIAFVNQVQTYSASTGVTYAAPAANHVGGNFLVVCFTYGVPGEYSGRIRVTDSAGNRYYEVGSRAYIEAGGNFTAKCGVWFAFNIKGHAANVVTATLYDMHGSGAATHVLTTPISLVVHQYSGMGSVMPDVVFDGVNTGPATLGVANTASLSPLTAGEALFVGTAKAASAGGTWSVTAGSSYTLINNTGETRCTTFYKVASAASTVTVTSTVQIDVMLGVCFTPRLDGYGLVNYTDAFVQGALIPSVSTAPMDHDYGHLLVVALTGQWTGWEINISDLAGHTWYEAITSPITPYSTRSRMWFVNPCKKFSGNVFTANFNTTEVPGGTGGSISIVIWEFAGRRWQLGPEQAWYWATAQRGSSTTPQLTLTSVENYMSVIAAVVDCSSQKPYPVEAARYQMDQPTGDWSAHHASLCRVAPTGGAPGGGPVSVSCLQGVTDEWVLTALALTAHDDVIPELGLINNHRRRRG